MWQENNQSSAQKSLDRFRSLLQRIEDLIPSAQKEKNFLNKKDVWQEILAQELVFLIDNQDRDQVKDLINLVKETKKQLQ